MNSRLAVVTAALALAFASAAHAQTSSGQSGNTAQPGVSSGAGASQPSRSQDRHQAAKQPCEKLQDNAREICNAEAEGQKKVSEAHAKLKQHDSPQNRLELAEARADAEFEVSKARCGDQIGDAAKACEDEAKAMRDLNKARAKRQALARADGSPTSGGSAAVTSGSPGSAGDTAASSSIGSAAPPAESPQAVMPQPTRQPSAQPSQARPQPQSGQTMQ